jgi:hypothetical protein
MGIHDRDYMRTRDTKHSGGRPPQRIRSGAPLWARVKFALWLVFRRLFGRR